MHFSHLLRNLLLLFSSGITLVFEISAQSQSADSLQANLEEMTVTGYRLEPGAMTSYNIEQLPLNIQNTTGRRDITDFLSSVPGISQLSTGAGISKPVIRGLYGNRILVLLNGLRFDNQQWQDEHSLGLSLNGIGDIEVIRGPFSILYGTEAIGGVINVIDAEYKKDSLLHSEAGLQFHSNTLGISTFYSTGRFRHNRQWKFLASLENHADYSDGRNTRVINSRSDAYQLRWMSGFRKKKWTSTNNLQSSFNRAGFIINDLDSFVVRDQRWSRNLGVNPAHYVLINSATSQNSIQLNQNTILQLNTGFQSNNRLENEGSGAISLNMHLLTWQYIARLELNLNSTNKLIVSNLFLISNNKNYGARKIIPDALNQEANLSGYLETSINSHFVIENGIGVGEKLIHTFLTPGVNTPDREIHVFRKFSPYYNAYTGFTYFPQSRIQVKGNLATGVRIANLAELSSNGLHEGVFTFEIGDPNLKNEQVFSANCSAIFKSRHLEFSLSPFYNYFSGFIYLSPTSTDWFGFPVYRYKQKDSRQYGLESLLSIIISRKLNLDLAYANMISRTLDGQYTPFLPPQKISTTLNFHFDNIKRPLNFFIGSQAISAQHKVADNEFSSKGYLLIDTGIMYSLPHQKNLIQISLTARNLLNKVYADHLSRLAALGIYNMGRNISLQLNYKL